VDRVGRVRLLAVAAVVAACSPGPSLPPSIGPAASPTPPAATAQPASIAPTPRGSLDRVSGWQADIAAIIPGLERTHPDPFHGTSKADMEAAVAGLSVEAPNLTDDQLMVGVSRIAALVSAKGCDGHTGVFMWGTGTYPVESLPLRLWLFADDVVIVDALSPHEDLIGATIETIEGMPIADVRARLDPLIPRDNAQTVRLLTPRYLLIPQVLRGIGLQNDSSVRFRYTKAGVSAEVDLASIPMEDYNNWAGPYGLHLPADPDVRYLSRIDDELWWEVLPDGETLYVQYNRVEFLGSNVVDLERALEVREIHRVVLDLRNNFGGEVRPLDTMVELFAAPEVDQPGELFVITGRNTFSAASLLVAKLEARTGASFIGEPMGGCLTFWGDTVELPLLHSGLSILVSSTFEVGANPNETRDNIELDAVAELAQEEWAAGDDPALDVLEIAAP
jgi:hypothetical protein